VPACDGKLFARFKRGPVFIETGTYAGDGVLAAIRAGFRSIYTIELDPGIHERAAAKFAHHPGIACIRGDSRVALGKVVGRHRNDNPLIWLDAHHSGGGTVGTGIHETSAEELDAILKVLGHEFPFTVMIDDLPGPAHFARASGEILKRWPHAVVTHEDGCGDARGGFSPIPKYIVTAVVDPIQQKNQSI